MRNPSNRKSPKGFTLVELTLVISLLLALTIGTVVGVQGYNNHKRGAEAGQKLKAIQNLTRISNAQRLPIDVASPSYGTGVTDIEHIYNGTAIPGITTESQANYAGTIVTFLAAFHSNSPDYDTLKTIYNNPVNGNASNLLFFSRDGNNVPRYMRIINGKPFFTTRSGITPYDPSGKPTDQLWDAGH